MNKCQAVAASTSEQCKRNALPGSKYCRLHIEKTPILVSAIVALGLSVSFRYAVPTDESRQLANVRVQLETGKEERANLEGEIKLLSEQRSI